MWAPRAGNNKTQFSEEWGFARDVLALTSPQPFILLAPVPQVTAGFCYIFYHYEPSVLKGRRGFSRYLKIILAESWWVPCWALALHVWEPVYALCTTRPRLIQSSLEERRISDESKGSLSPPTLTFFGAALRCTSSLSIFTSIYTFFRGLWVEKNKERSIRVHLSAITVACWFWKLRGETLMPHFISLSLTLSGCPGREASSKLRILLLWLSR